MPFEPKDPGVALAIQYAVNHPPPYTDEELASVTGAVHLNGAKDLAELARCPGITELDLLACDVDLSVLAALPNVRTLRIVCCRIAGGLSALAARPELETLELLYSDITDLSPVVGHPNLRRGILNGLPLDDTSWGVLRETLSRATVPATGKRALWTFSSPSDHRRTREMWDAGLKLCFAMFDSRLPILVRPGMPRSRRVGVEYVMAAPALIESVRAENPDAESEDLHRAVVRRVHGRTPRRPFNFRSAREIGDAGDAQEWVEFAKEVPNGDKAVLAAFVHRFRDQVFFRETSGITGIEEQRLGVKIPIWLVNYRYTVAGVAPSLLAPDVAYHAHNDAPAPDGATDGWYSLALAGLYDPAHEPVLRAGWFCVGFRHGPDPLVLVVRVRNDAGDDPSVYAYDPASLDVGHTLTAPPTRVFHSWMTLLRSVDAIRVGDQIAEPLPEVD